MLLIAILFLILYKLRSNFIRGINDIFIGFLSRIVTVMQVLVMRNNSYFCSTLRPEYHSNKHLFALVIRTTFFLQLQK